MNCKECKEQAVINKPARCKKHFIESFEKNVEKTITRFNLIHEGEKIVVAASGGKDSLALLHILKKNYEVEALAINEGIPGYRDKTLEDLKTYCKEKNIPLNIITFEDIGAKPLHKTTTKNKCATCGVLRRKALLQGSKDYDLIATGHNLDDECQSILMNLLRNQESLLARIGPRTKATPGVPPRIKPFYLTPEKEIRAYCILQGIQTNFTECPNAPKSFRWAVGEEINKLEQQKPGSKKNMIEHFLKQEYTDNLAGGKCSLCASPSSGDMCKACTLIQINA